MKKKDMFFYILAAVLAGIIMWQWISASADSKAMHNMDAYNRQLQFLLGIGQLNSAHVHADVKVYINGKSVDFSQKKYQITTNYIHFEDGIGDAVHVHASGMTVGHIVRAVGGTFSGQCLDFEGQNYCNDDKNSLKFYVNGKANSEFDNHIIEDLDKYLISFGPRSENMQPQIASITDLARVYSKK